MEHNKSKFLEVIEELLKDIDMEAEMIYVEISSDTKVNDVEWRKTFKWGLITPDLRGDGYTLEDTDEPSTILYDVPSG
jgi:hypothetical protein